MPCCCDRFNAGTHPAGIVYVAFSSHLAKIRVAEAAIVFPAYKSGLRLLSVFVFHNLLFKLSY